YRCADDILESEDRSNFNTSNTVNETAVWCRNPSSCSEWIYDDPDSFVAEFQLACQDWKRTLIGSVHSFGYMIGLLIVGPLSDRFGRKSLIIVTGIAGTVFGTVKTFVSSYWCYVALELLEAAIGDFGSPLYMLCLEMVATKSRVTFSTICNMGFGIGGLVLPLLARLILYWRTLLRVMYFPGLLTIFLIYLLDESPRWLLVKGKKSAALEIIRNAAKMNKIEIKENLNLLYFEKDNESRFIAAIKDTFKSRSILKRVFVCIVWWITCTLVNYGMAFNSLILKGNKYVNFAISSGMDILSLIFGVYILQKFNRTGPLTTSFLACAIFCIGQPFIPNNLLWLVNSTYMAGKLMASIAFNTVYIFTSELFPTHTRNSMHALCSSIGRIGSIIAPQLPLLMVYWTGLPNVIFGAVSLVAGLLTLLVPDTADRNLPDTVGQAEALEVGSEKIASENKCCKHRMSPDCTRL
ncbi:organic cation transporter protein-like, partial [Cydia strobilella]|uniref:organic cation transporter protein-like n=1 Tax=Cydia strobilella TaxID=1100964 RepID=UPI003007972E